MPNVEKGNQLESPTASVGLDVLEKRMRLLAHLRKPKPLPALPTSRLETPQPAAATPQATSQAPNAKPLPAPITLKLRQRVAEVRGMELEAEWEFKKDDTLNRAVALAQKGDVTHAAALIEELASKEKGTSLKPLSETHQPGKQEAQDPLEGGGDPDDDDSEEILSADFWKEAKKAARSLGASVAEAQKKLADEDEAFRRVKMVKKSDKIKASKSQEQELNKKREEKTVKEAERVEKSWRDYLSFGKKGDQTLTAEEKKEKTRIEIAQTNKKLDDEIKKYGKGIDAIGMAGKGDAGFAKTIGKTLEAGNTGDDIASAAGTLATSTAGVASSLVTVGREFRLYAKTSGAERTVHLKKATSALGGAFGNLVNMTRSTLNVAEHAGAMEAGSAIPILGIVAALPSLMAEINDLRSAMIRLAKQQKTYFELEQQIEDGDASQTTLFTLVSAFIARDTEAVGKLIAKVVLDFTKIAGHGVTAGGITGPIGVALVAVSSAGKLVISGVGSTEDLIAANRANDRRKKLQPTLKDHDDWKGLARERPDPTAAAALTKALEALAKEQKGSKEHALALDEVCACAATVGQAKGATPKIVEFTRQLVVNAKQEKQIWQEIDTDNEGDDAQGQPPKSGQQDAHQRNASKLLKQDPQLAAQALLDQAQREGPPGGPAFKVLRSFGIKASQVYSDEKDDDRVGSNREIRQKILFKLAAEDESAQTLSQTLSAAKDSVKSYLSMGVKHEELANYMEAKDLLKHGNNKSKRNTLWQLKMDLLTDDVEEKKEALLAQVNYLVEQNDIEETLAKKVRALLLPRAQRHGETA